MNHKVLISVIAILALLTAGTVTYASLAPQPATEAHIQSQSKYDVGAPDAQEMLELVNAERAKYGVAPLAIDERLNQSAQMKADDMVKYHYFGHVNHDGTQAYQVIGKTMAKTCQYASENIRNNDEYINTSREAFDAWVKSPPHHAAMIDTKYSLTGFGVNSDLAVEHFCQAR